MVRSNDPERGEFPVTERNERSFGNFDWERIDDVSASWVTSLLKKASKLDGTNMTVFPKDIPYCNCCFDLKGSKKYVLSMNAEEKISRECWKKM